MLHKYMRDPIASEEFSGAVASHFAWSKWVVWPTFAVGLLVFAGAWRFVSYTEIQLAFYLIALAILVSGLGTWWNEHRSWSDSRLACPQCDRALQLYSGFVIHKGRCPFCGQRVLADRGSGPKSHGKEQLWPDDTL